MELLKNYYEELHAGKSIIYDDHGFASYWLREKEVYIEDIYVKPEYRKSHSASHYADQIAEIGKAHGCEYMIGSVVPSANQSTISLKVLLGYGFRLLSSEDNIIWFNKELI